MTSPPQPLDVLVIESQSGRSAAIQVGLLFALSCVIYIALAGGVDLPIIAPDEFTYGGLARSIADGNGLTLLGQHVSVRSPLYLYLLAPAWLGDSTETAYTATKIIGAISASLTVIPVWFLARTLVPPRWALAASGLAVAGTWMTVTSSILLENAAYPLSAAALVCTVRAVGAPGSRWGWAALGFAFAATAVRTQLAVLVPILALAVLADAALAGPSWKERLRAHQRLALVSGGLSLAGLLIVLVSKSTAVGALYQDLDLAPKPHAILSAVAWQSIGVVTMLGILPVVCVGALSSSRAVWRDEHLRPLLVVLWISIVVFVAESGWTIAGLVGLNWHIERYVMYVVPLAILAFIAGLQRGLLSWRRVAVVTVLAAAVLAIAPPIRNTFEEAGQFAMTRRMHDLLGTSPALGIVLWTLVLGGAATLIVRARGTAPAWGVALLAVLAFAVQDQQAWSWKTDAAHTLRKPFPADLQWLDHHSTEPVAVLVGTANTQYSDVNKLFNRSIQTQLLPTGTSVGGRYFFGTVCRWATTPTGVLTVTGGCDPSQRRFYLEDPLARFTFYDQTIEADRKDFARVVTTPQATPARLEALLRVICAPRLRALGAIAGDGRPLAPPANCAGRGIFTQFWLDRPATLALTFRGGQQPQRIMLGKIRAVPPNVVTTFRVGVPAASATQPVQATFAIDWDGMPPATPDLISAVLIQGTKRTQLLY